MDPNDPTIFKPVASPKVTFKKLNDAIKEYYSGSQDGLESPMDYNLIDKVKSGLGKKIMKRLESEIGKKDRIQKKEHQISEQKLIATDSTRLNMNFISPMYKEDERLGIKKEYNQPPLNLFEPLGWDRMPGESNEKHYRRFHTQELETVVSCMKKPSDFDQYELKKGQVRGASQGVFDGLFSKQNKDENGEVSTSKSCGKFKGLIKVTPTSKRELQKEEISSLLGKVYDLLSEIHTKTFMKPFPFKRGLFGEINITQKMLGDNKSDSMKEENTTFGGQSKKLKD